MVARPMKLDEALNLQGYTIDVTNALSRTITLPEGVIEIPAMPILTLTWQRDRPPEPIDSMYLTRLPVFHNDYRPYALSILLGHYRSRRIGYNTPGEFANAVLRWYGVNLGGTSVLNKRWRSTAVQLPLDDRDETDHRTLGETEDKTHDEARNASRDIEVDGTTGERTEATTHKLDVGSDFPQSLISGSGAYATAATDQRGADNKDVSGTNRETTGETNSENANASDHRSLDEDELTRRTGRGVSVMRLLQEQRDAFVNVDLEFRDAFEPLMLGLFDQGEGDRPDQWPDIRSPWWPWW